MDPTYHPIKLQRQDKSKDGNKQEDWAKTCSKRNVNISPKKPSRCTCLSGWTWYALNGTLTFPPRSQVAVLACQVRLDLHSTEQSQEISNLYWHSPGNAIWRRHLFWFCQFCLSKACSVTWDRVYILVQGKGRCSFSDTCRNFIPTIHSISLSFTLNLLLWKGGLHLSL